MFNFCVHFSKLYDGQCFVIHVWLYTFQHEYAKVKSLKEELMPKKERTTRNFALRLDSETMEAIEKWAADEFRSVNGQIQWILDQALKKNGRLKK